MLYFFVVCILVLMCMCILAAVPRASHASEIAQGASSIPLGDRAADCGGAATDVAPPDAPSMTPPVTTTSAAAEAVSEVTVQASEPKFVAPTRHDRIGRIWAPVSIDGRGPYRLVLDTGANRSVLTVLTAQTLRNGCVAGGSPQQITGFTGSSLVPTIHVERLEVGDLILGPLDMPVIADAFGGAQGVLGMDGFQNRRVLADFTRDHLEISRSHGERAPADYIVVPLQRVRGGLLEADVLVGTVHAKAIIDTGAQGTVGNLSLRDSLMRHLPANASHEDIVGVTLDVQGGDNVLMPDVVVGQLRIERARITFGDMYLFRHWKLTREPTMVLGMDLLGTVDVLVVDYRRQELQVRVPRSEGVYLSN